VKQGVDDSVAERVQAAHCVVQRERSDCEGPVKAIPSLVCLDHVPVIALKGFQQAAALADEGILADDGDVVMQ